MKDHYATLGINKDATQEEIKSAYRKLAIQFHPDKHNGEKYYENRFKEINEAHAILSDPYKKENYDYYFGNEVDSSWLQTTSGSTGYYPGSYSNTDTNTQPNYQYTYSNSQKYTPQKNLPYANVVIALGVISILGCLFYGIVGLTTSSIAIILAHKDTKRFTENGDLYTTTSYLAIRAGNTMAIIGLVLSLIYLAILGLVSVLRWIG